MDDYSLLNIFDQLDFGELLRTAESSHRFADLILTPSFMKKHNLDEKKISIVVGQTIYIGFSRPDLNLQQFTSSYNQTLLVVKHLGHMFSELYYEFARFGSDETQKMIEYVEKYCPQTTKNIIISGLDEIFLLNWRHSFDNTTNNVELSGRTIAGSIELNDFFPYMKQLTVHFTREAITKWLVQHFPHLIDFSMKVSFGVDNNDDLMEFIQLNPQLRTFGISLQNNDTFIKYVNEMLPDLETLDIVNVIHAYQVLPNREIIRFKKVKKFTYHISSSHLSIANIQHVIVPIAFDQLESLTLFTTEFVSSDELIDMISLNSELKSVDTNMMLNQAQLLRLLILPMLEELSISWDRYKRMSEWKTILLANNRVRRINIRVHNDFVKMIDFKEFLPSGWKVSQQNIFRWVNVVSFIRVD